MSELGHSFSSGLCLLVLAAAAMAQEPPPPDEAHGMEAQLVMPEHEDSTAAYGSEDFVVSIHGFLDLKYEDSQDKRSSFDLHHANLFIEGSIDDELEAVIEIEYEHGSERIELDQTEILYRPAGSSLTLAAGRFYAPFGIERFTWYPPLNPMISRPAVFRHVVPGNWYETGLRADYRRGLGEELELRGELAVTNGLGSDARTDVRAARQFRDNNSNRALIGRLSGDIGEKLTLGVSGATMKYDERNRISFAGVDAEYREDRLLLRGEWVRSRVEDPQGAAGDFSREGFYVLGSYRLWADGDSHLDLAGRIETIDRNKSVDSNTDLSSYAIGLGLAPRSNLGLKLEYQWNAARHGLSPGSTNTAVLQVVLDF
ncbi:MAG: porin [Planctomycetota bacterium]